MQNAECVTLPRAETFFSNAATIVCIASASPHSSTSVTPNVRAPIRNGSPAQTRACHPRADHLSRGRFLPADLRQVEADQPRADAIEGVAHREGF